MSFVIRYIVSSTGPEEGHRFAALSIVRSLRHDELLADG